METCGHGIIRSFPVGTAFNLAALVVIGAVAERAVGTGRAWVCSCCPRWP